MIEEIVVLALLVAISAFFSGAEIALFSISNIKVRKLLRARRRGAKTLAKLKSQPHRMLVTILVSNNIVNISAASLATVVATRYFGSAGIGLAAGIMTLTILVFGEIVPKSYFHHNAERMSLLLAQPVYLLGYILYPVIIVIEAASGIILRMLRVKRKKDEITEEEIVAALSLGAESGAIERDESEIMQNVIEFGETRVREVMTPKRHVVTLFSNERLIDAVSKTLETQYSRTPVLAHGTRKILGILNIKDTLKYMKAKEFDIPVVKVVSPAIYVREDDMLDVAFEKLKESSMHMAIVRNRAGDFTGIITMEDLLEEIVGEIYDESDRKRIRVHFIDRSTAIVRGDTSAEDIRKKIGLPISGKSTTISEIISERYGGRPRKGQFIELKNFTLTVLETDKKDPSKVRRIKIIKRRGKIRK